MRTFVVGDIHGGLRALKQVMERSACKPGDALFFLGDYVDGWSESAQLIDYLMELEKEYSCRFIYGNHDAWCYDWLKNDKVNSNWYQHGGKETMASYSSFSDTEKKSHIQFFERMEHFFVDDQNRLFVHAGFSDMYGPKFERDKNYLGWDRTLWEMALALHGNIQTDDPHYPKRLQLFREIYIGHTPTLEWGIEHPWNRMNVWNMDTGAAFTGKVSMMDIDTKDYWQSDTVCDLYPDELGRNKAIPFED